MRKLILTCDNCGQRMQVPRSAIGRTGMCPSCNATIKIKSNNTVTAPDPKRSLYAASRGGWWRGVGSQPTEDAKRKFGEAVDLFYNGRHGEALAIFDMLNQQFPGNPDIENGRQQCLNALRRPQQSYALEDHSGGPPPVEGRLDRKTIRSIVLDKMLRGRTEEVQLQAADIAAQLLGLYDKPQPEDEDESDNENVIDADSEEVEPGTNGQDTEPSGESGEASEDATGSGETESDEEASKREEREPRVGWGGIFEL